MGVTMLEWNDPIPMLVDAPKALPRMYLSKEQAESVFVLHAIRNGDEVYFPGPESRRFTTIEELSATIEPAL